MIQAIIELLLVATLVLLSAAMACGQTVTVYFPPMPIHKVRPGLWLTAKEIADVEVTFPGEKKMYRLKRDASDKGQATIPPTFSRGIFRRAVDPCDCVGVLEDGSTFLLHLPREPVRGRVAVAITCDGTITRPNGQVWNIAVIIPDCVTRRDGFRRRLADAVVGMGTITRSRP